MEHKPLCITMQMLAPNAYLLGVIPLDDFCGMLRRAIAGIETEATAFPFVRVNFSINGFELQGISEAEAFENGEIARMVTEYRNQQASS